MAALVCKFLSPFLCSHHHHCCFWCCHTWPNLTTTWTLLQTIIENILFLCQILCLIFCHLSFTVITIVVVFGAIIIFDQNVFGTVTIDVYGSNCSLIPVSFVLKLTVSLPYWVPLLLTKWVFSTLTIFLTILWKVKEFGSYCLLILVTFLLQSTASLQFWVHALWTM